MKLSKLIQYMQTVHHMTADDPMRALHTTVSANINDIRNGMADLDIEKYINDINLVYEDGMDELCNLNDAYDALLDFLQKERQKLEHDAMETSYKRYEVNKSMGDPENHFLPLHDTQTMIYEPEAIEAYHARIKLYGSWKHPGLMIRPYRGDYLKSMLHCDPLYVADESHGLLEPIRDMFTTAYQRRLRYKVINEDNKPYLTDIVPNGQIGFILANEYLNWRPLEVIEDYLKEFLTLLKPGGVVMFTFNNGDVPGAVSNFEAGLYMYTPARLLRAMVEKLGYDVLYEYKHASNVFWFEIKKPGELESIRGGQTIGVIKDRKT